MDPEAPLVSDADWVEGFSLVFSLVKTYAPLWASSSSSGSSSGGHPVGTPPAMSGAKKKADAAQADMKQTHKKFDLSENEGSQADDASSEAASMSTGGFMGACRLLVRSPWHDGRLR